VSCDRRERLTTGSRTTGDKHGKNRGRTYTFDEIREQMCTLRDVIDNCTKKGVVDGDV